MNNKLSSLEKTKDLVNDINKANLDFTDDIQDSVVKTDMDNNLK